MKLETASEEASDLHFVQRSPDGSGDNRRPHTRITIAERLVVMRFSGRAPSPHGTVTTVGRLNVTVPTRSSI